MTRWNIGVDGLARTDRRSAASWANYAARTGASIVGLARYVREHGIDVVHCDGTPSGGGIGMAVAGVARARLLVHLHETLERYPGTQREHSPMRRRVERTTARRADRLVAVSRFIADEVRAAGVTVAPVDVVPNGVDLDRFSPEVDGALMRREYGIGDDEPLALQAGRVLESKRQQDFVRAVALARRRVPKLRGLVVGWDDPRQPPSKADLRRLCEEEGLGDAIVIAEARPEAPELMAAADILVSPGLEESSGLVAMEAMATGKPVIGARSGGTMEIVLDGETGFLVPPKAHAALAEELVLLASDVELRRRMGAAGRRRAEREFDGRLPAVRFAAIYDELASAPNGRERVLRR